MDAESSTRPRIPRVLVTSDEINLLVYAYLCESRFEHAAYSLRNEARLDSSPILRSLTDSSDSPQANGAPNGKSRATHPVTPGSAGGKRRDSSVRELLDGQGDGQVRELQSELAGMIPRGKLVTMLQSGLMFSEAKAHAGQPPSDSCNAPFRLLTPHACSSDPANSPPLAFTALEDFDPMDMAGISQRSDLLPVPPTLERPKPGKRRRTKGVDGAGTATSSRAASPPVNGDADADEDVEMEDVSEEPTKQRRGRKTPAKDADTSSEASRSKRPGSSRGADAQSVASGTNTPRTTTSRLPEDKASKVPTSKSTVRTEGSPERETRKEPSQRKRKLSQGDASRPKVAEEAESTSAKAKKGKQSRFADASPSRASSSNAPSPSKADPTADDTLLPVEVDNGVVHWRANHSKQVLHLAWNPQQTNRIASCAADNTCLIWDFDDVKVDDAESSGDLQALASTPTSLVHRSIESRKAVNDLAWNPDGSIVATSSDDGVARTFAFGEMYAILARHSRPIHSLAFNPSGNYLATTSQDSTVCVWAVAMSQAPLVMSIAYHDGEVFYVDWLDDETFATCSEDKTIAILSAKSSIPNKVLRGHEDRVMVCKFSPAGDSGEKRYLASGSDDKSIRIWDIFDEKLAGSDAGRSRTPAPPSTAKGTASPAVGSGRQKQAVSEDGKGSDYFGERAKVEPYLVKKLEGHEDDVTHLAWSPRRLQPDGRRLLASACRADSASASKHGYVVKMWDVEAGTCLWSLETHTDMINALEFSPKGEMLVSCSDEGMVVVSESDTGRELKRYEADVGINDVKWRIDGQQLAMAAHDGSMRTMYVGDLYKDVKEQQAK